MSYYGLKRKHGSQDIKQFKTNGPKSQDTPGTKGFCL